MIVLPRVKKQKETGGEFEFSRVSAVAEKDTEAAVNLLESFCADYGIPFVRNSDKPNVKFVEKSFERAEEYELEVTESGATAFYGDASGARNAAATLCAAAVCKDGKLVCPCMSVSDYPDSGYRGFMIDFARKYIPVDEVKRLLSLMAALRYNTVHFHLLDTEHYALDSKAVPALSANPLFLNYSLDEMRMLGAFARSLGLAVIPEIDLPGHGLMVLEKMPELRCKDKFGKPSIWDACVCNDALYETIDKLLGELTTIFDFEYFHLGGDELSFRDLKDSGYWASWYTCERCEKLGAGESDAEYFYHFVMRAYEIVKKHGKKLIIFNDAIDVARDIPLPRDITLQFWRIAGDGRGPHKGCTFDKFLKAGFNVINSFYEETYADTELRMERLSKWNPRSSPEHDGKRAGQILGGEMCAWGRVPHFAWTLPSSLIIMADRLWNDAPLADDDETEEAMQRQLISRIPLKSRVYTLLGGKILPMNGDKYFKRDKYPTAEQAIEAVRELTGIERERFSDEHYTRTIKDCMIALMSALIY